MKCRKQKQYEMSFLDFEQFLSQKFLFRALTHAWVDSNRPVIT